MPTKLTITEALAELKTNEKRVEKKQMFIGQYLTRLEREKDPLLKEGNGGSVTAITTEQQAINDLNERRVQIRMAIAKANAETTVTVQGETRSIAEWIVWRREVAPKVQAFLTRLAQGLQISRKNTVRGAHVIAAAAAVNVDNKTPDDLIVNIDESDLNKRAEKLELILGELDGQLSLKNATVTVDIP